jgi:hypothetical protein
MPAIVTPGLVVEKIKGQENRRPHRQVLAIGRRRTLDAQLRDIPGGLTHTVAVLPR